MNEHAFKPIIDVIRQANMPKEYECYLCGKHVPGKQLNDHWSDEKEQWIHICKSCDPDE